MVKRTLKYLFLIGFTLVVTTAALGQGGEVSDEPALIVPVYGMDQVVRRILIWSFKPRNKKRIVYLSGNGIDPAWLPRIKNVDFRLLSDEEVQQRRPKGFYFFRPLDFEPGVYEIGFGFGVPPCKGSGNSWRYRMSGQKVKLWVNALFGIGCGSGMGTITGSGQSNGCLGPKTYH